MKKILLIIVGLVILILGAAVALPFIFKDKIIDFAKSEANRKINAKLNFSNDIGVNLFRSFPNFSVELKDVSVIGKAPFEGDTLIYFPRIDVTLDIQSVLKGEKMQIRSFNLDKPYIYLQKLADGTANWDITFPSQDTLAAEGKDTTSNFRVILDRYAINNAHIIYDDRQAGMYADVNNMTHTGKGDFSNEIFDLETVTDIDKLTYKMSSVPYLSEVKTHLGLNLNINQPKNTYTLKENELRLNDFAVKWDGSIAMPDTQNINLDLKFSSPATSFKSLLSLIPAIYKKDFDKLQAEGKLGFDGFVKGTYNNKQLPGFRVNLAVANGMFKYPDLPVPVNNVNVQVTAENPGGDADLTVVNIPKAQFAMGQEPFSMRMLVKTPISDPYIDGSVKGKLHLGRMQQIIKLDPGTSVTGLVSMDLDMKGNLSSIEKKQYEKFNARGHVQSENITYRSPDIAQAVRVPTSLLTFSPQEVRVTNTKVLLGQSDVNVTGSLRNFLSYFLREKGTLDGDLNLTSSFFDLNPLMQDEGKGASKQTPAKEEKPEAIELPGNIRFAMTSNFGQVKYANWDIRNVKSDILLNDKRLDFRDLSLAMLNGTFTGKGYYDTRTPKSPKTEFDLNIKDVNIPEAYKTIVPVQQFAPIAKYMTGSMNAVMHINTPLDQGMLPIWQSFTSNGNLNLEQIAIENYPVLQALAAKLAKPSLAKLQLKDIKPSYFIENGRFNLREPIRFTHHDIKAEVTGSSGLDKTLDYKAELEIPTKGLQIATQSELDKLLKNQNMESPIGKSVKVDAFIGGTMDKPTVRLAIKDFSAGALKAAKDALKEELNKKKKEAEDRAKAELEKAKGKAEAERKRLEGEAKRKLDEEKKRLEDERRKKEEELRKKADEEKKRVEEEAKKKLKDIFKR